MKIILCVSTYTRELENVKIRAVYNPIESSGNGVNGGKKLLKRFC